MGGLKYALRFWASPPPTLALPLQGGGDKGMARPLALFLSLLRRELPLPPSPLTGEGWGGGEGRLSNSQLLIRRIRFARRAPGLRVLGQLDFLG